MDREDLIDAAYANIIRRFWITLREDLELSGYPRGVSLPPRFRALPYDQRVMIVREQKRRQALEFVENCSDLPRTFTWWAVLSGLDPESTRKRFLLAANRLAD